MVLFNCFVVFLRSNPTYYVHHAACMFESQLNNIRTAQSFRSSLMVRRAAQWCEIIY